MKKQLLAAVAASALAIPAPAVLAQGNATPQTTGSETENQAQQNEAQQNQTMPADDQGELAEQDRQFVDKASAANRAEIELAELAQQSAEDEEVKDYAATMLTDHGKAADELKKIAQELQIELSTELSPEAQRAKDELSGLQGAAFDRAYIDHMVKDHEKAVKLFEDEAANGENEALKQFASTTVDTLRIHLDRARELDRQMGAEPVAGAPGGSPSASTEESIAGDQETPAQQQPTNPLMEVTAGELIGKTVVNQQGDEVGEIEDVVIGTGDKQVQAVVSVGGFLGIGDKSIAMSFDELRQGQDGNILLTSGATVDELKQRPAYEEGSGDFERYPPEKTPAESAL